MHRYMTKGLRATLMHHLQCMPCIPVLGGMCKLSGILACQYPEAIPVTWKPVHAPAHSSEPHSGHLSCLRGVPCHCWTRHGPACPSHQGQGCVQGLPSSALSFQTAAAEEEGPAARNLAFHTHTHTRARARTYTWTSRVCSCCRPSRDQHPYLVQCQSGDDLSC